MDSSIRRVLVLGWELRRLQCFEKNLDSLWAATGTVTSEWLTSHCHKQCWCRGTGIRDAFAWKNIINSSQEYVISPRATTTGTYEIFLSSPPQSSLVPLLHLLYLSDPCWSTWSSVLVSGQESGCRRTIRQQWFRSYFRQPVREI